MFGRIKRLDALFCHGKAKQRIILASLQSSDNAGIMSKGRSVMVQHSEQPSCKPKDYLVWIDMEMTGLDVSRDSILEVACLITDPSLNIIGEGPDLIIHQPNNILQSMNAWSLEHHAKSGLTEASRQSNVTLQAAEQEIISFLRNHIPPGTCPLAGNSVYMDRLFIIKHMPQVDKYLHYRIIDVSTVKELCRRWKPEVYKAAPQKVLAHRALDDIKESIGELKYYKSTFFNI